MRLDIYSCLLFPRYRMGYPKTLTPSPRTPYGPGPRTTVRTGPRNPPTDPLLRTPHKKAIIKMTIRGLTSGEIPPIHSLTMKSKRCSHNL